MQNEILTINLSTIKLKKIKIHNSEKNTMNKSTNTLLTTFINSNQRFNNNCSDLNTISTKKNINPYFIKNPKQKIFVHKKEIKHRNNDYYILPILSNNNKSVKQNKEEKQNLFDNIKKNKIKIRRQKELLINPVSLYLITLSNENQNQNKKINSTKNKGNKVKDEFLERVKDYRKRLKEQMIKRNKFQYSHSNNSLNKSHSQQKEKEQDKEKEKDNENIRFNYNQSNNYIFNMNENVDKALNIFYNNLKSSRIIRYDKNKSNLNSEKNLSSLSNNNDINNQNKFHTINIK